MACYLIKFGNDDDDKEKRAKMKNCWRLIKSFCHLFSFEVNFGLAFCEIFLEREFIFDKRDNYQNSRKNISSLLQPQFLKLRN